MFSDLVRHLKKKKKNLMVSVLFSLMIFLFVKVCGKVVFSVLLICFLKYHGIFSNVQFREWLLFFFHFAPQGHGGKFQFCIFRFRSQRNTD